MPTTRRNRGRLAVPDFPRLDELKGKQVMTLSNAFFAEAEHVPLKKAAGRVAAEMVSPYPPGIPRIVPGERITEANVRYLEAGLRAGLFAMDPKRHESADRPGRRMNLGPMPATWRKLACQ
jgi:arginine decarboxylase